jgi:hypothetical protein
MKLRAVPSDAPASETCGASAKHRKYQLTECQIRRESAWGLGRILERGVIGRHECLLLAHSEHSGAHDQCPLSGVGRTWPIAVQMSAYDPKQKS